MERNVKAPMEAKINAATEDYNSHCAENRVGKLPPAQFENCNAWKGRAAQYIASQQQEWTNYSTQWNKQNIDPINATIAKQNVRIEQNNAAMKANFKRFTDAQDSFIAIKKRIAVILAKLKKLCDPLTVATNDEPFTKEERIKWCSGIDFDGYDRTLPPMYTYKGTGGVSAN